MNWKAEDGEAESSGKSFSSFSMSALALIFLIIDLCLFLVSFRVRLSNWFLLSSALFLALIRSFSEAFISLGFDLELTDVSFFRFLLLLVAMAVLHSILFVWDRSTDKAVLDDGVNHLSRSSDNNGETWS